MPNVSNVQLQIEHTTTQQTPAASRDVTVNYQVGFTQAEVDARANFQVKVSLLSNDNDTTLPVTVFNLTAVSSPVLRTEKKTFHRQQLDEEPDFEIIIDSQGHPHRVASEMPDSWRARVLTTFVPGTVFGSAMGDSGAVNGSWGAQGHD
jgi:hypothetical protein